MKFQRHSPRSFIKRTQDLLSAAREQNHLLRALALRLEEGTMTLSGTPLLATVDDAEGPVLAVLRTPPGNLIVSTGRIEATNALAAGLRAHDIALPGVTGPREIADAFASIWATHRELVNLVRVRSCSASEDLPDPAGVLRLANDNDIEIVARWVADFGSDIFSDRVDSQRFVLRRVAEQAVWVWEQDDTPSSMACVDGDTREGVRLDWIYTPPELRGRGFAKSCVSQLTKQQLSDGKQFCLAHAMTADARANSLLDSVGFAPVGVQGSWRFEP